MPRLATVMISYKRPELLRQTLESYLETVTLPYDLLVVDNGGSAENLDVTKQLGVETVALGTNTFPGHATNLGWDRLLGDDVDFLHRSDNDVEYLPGWCDEVTEMFSNHPNLGQLGLRTLEEEGNYPNVGGNCVVTPKVFARVRWEDAPWQRGRATEDFFFTRAIDAAGFEWARALTPCIVHLGIADRSIPYYAETWHA